MLNCPICNQPRDARYENRAAGEACVYPDHWPYLSAEEVANASRVMDLIRFHAERIQNRKQSGAVS